MVSYRVVSFRTGVGGKRPAKKIVMDISCMHIPRERLLAFFPFSLFSPPGYTREAGKGKRREECFKAYRGNADSRGGLPCLS